MNRDEFTIAEHHFKTADGIHTLYVHEWGNTDGKPILYLHGGPGNGCDDRAKLSCDPKLHRVIFLDQRGSGQSTPLGSLHNNSTDYLINDLEMIRAKLNIECWTIRGSSWGSTLALYYAIKYPEQIDRLVISGIWLQIQQEHDWLFGGGWRHTFPELWHKFTQSVPTKYMDNPAKYHFENAFNKSSKTSKQSLFELINLEYTLVHLDEKKKPLRIEDFDEDSTKIEMHYLANNCFLTKNYIVNNVDKLNMPINIIQSRYDMICPPSSAYFLHTKLTNSTLTWTLGGHAMNRDTSDSVEQTLKLI